MTTDDLPWFEREELHSLWPDHHGDMTEEQLRYLDHFRDTRLWAELSLLAQLQELRSTIESKTNPVTLRLVYLEVRVRRWLNRPALKVKKWTETALIGLIKAVMFIIRVCPVLLRSVFTTRKKEARGGHRNDDR